MTSWNRRNFIRCATMSTVIGGGLRAIVRFDPVVLRTQRLRLGVVRRPGPSSTLDGVTLGAEEAARSADLLGRQVEIVMADIGDASIERAARLLLEHDVSMILATFASAEDCEILATHANATGTPVLNAAASADRLRDLSCTRTLFHVAASDAMYRTAIAAGRLAVEDERVAVMWRPELEHFGGAQLNASFQARFGHDMNGLAWAGWLAAKIAVESFLRAGTSDRVALRQYLAREDVQFDGRKGVPLSFRPADHQLRQPLYIVDPADRSVSDEDQHHPQTGSTLGMPRLPGCDWHQA